MKSCSVAMWGVAAMALVAMASPGATVDAGMLLRGSSSHGGSHHDDAHVDPASFFGDDLVDEHHEGDELFALLANNGDDHEEADEEDGSTAHESDLSDSSHGDGNSETFGFDALDDDSAEHRGKIGGGKSGTEQVDLPPTTIGESAAAAKDINSIDPAAIQRDPKSYGVLTPAPSTDSPAQQTPTTIGESAAAAKDINSIDPAAIQRDPKSYGVLTPALSPVPAATSLSESEMAAKPLSPAANNYSPKQSA